MLAIWLPGNANICQWKPLALSGFMVVPMQALNCGQDPNQVGHVSTVNTLDRSLYLIEYAVAVTMSF